MPLAIRRLFLAGALCAPVLLPSPVRLSTPGCLAADAVRSAQTAPADTGAQRPAPGRTDQGPGNLCSALHWRLIGPFRGGRTPAVAGVTGQPNTYYLGSAGGGVFKTTNGGVTWVPIFDGQPIASIGALAVAPFNPNIVYVGTGEADIRSDVAFGDGVYKSTDAGATWSHVGLRDTRQIGRIVVDPTDPDIALVAALGHAYGPNADRGVFRTVDGGRTWSKVLYKDENTGAVDLAFDPDNAKTVYAAMWNARRVPWTAYAPVDGPGSGLWKSTDGGVTWSELVDRGLPAAPGRIGVAVAAGQQGRRVYAIVQAPQAGGLYRSDDAGASWMRVGADPRIDRRGWYFNRVTVDPRDPETVYVPNVGLYRSNDGGGTFEAIKGAPGGDDYHFLWIAPDDPRRMIVGSDQGATISVDRGATWSSWDNQPTAQFYHVAVDNQFPYYVYGAQQDSGSAAVASRSDYGRITFRDWHPIGAGESGYVWPDPVDPAIVYGGDTSGQVYRFVARTGQVEDVSPEPIRAFRPDVSEEKYRFPWTAAIAFSPFPPHALYHAAQVLFKTTDGGRNWTPISGDLTRRAGSGQPGPYAGRDRTSAVICAVAPSRVAPGQIWAGTDNGLVKLTRDEGATWRDVTPPDVQPWSRVSLIEASRFAAGTAYAAVERHELDDLAPYIYRTHDYGTTWTTITDGLPVGAFVRAVREDGVRKGLLFAGTELGVYMSSDDGGHWQPLQLNLPACSIRDLAVKGDDLVVATHGRAFWILDDIAPLREMSPDILRADAHLFKPASAIRIRPNESNDTPLPPETPAGENPPDGAIIDYMLNREPVGDLTIEIRDGARKIVRRFSSADPTADSRPRMPNERADFPSYWLRIPPSPTRHAGLNRFVWDLRYPKPPAVVREYSISATPGRDTPSLPEGPLVLPGKYEITLAVGGRTYQAPLVVRQDPRVNVPLAALSAQLAFEQHLGDALVASDQAMRAIDLLRRQVAEATTRLGAGPGTGSLRDALNAVDAQALELAGALPPGTTPTFRSLNSSIGGLLAIVDRADAAPTSQARRAFASDERSLATLLDKWAAVRRAVPDINRQLRERNLPEISLA